MSKRKKEKSIRIAYERTIKKEKGERRKSEKYREVSVTNKNEKGNNKKVESEEVKKGTQERKVKERETSMGRKLKEPGTTNKIVQITKGSAIEIKHKGKL